MKKAICAILLVIAVLFSGCGRETGESFTKSGRLIIVSNSSNSNAPYFDTVVADKDTGVLYLVIYAGNHCGITPLLNADGTPMLWKEENERE